MTFSYGHGETRTTSAQLVVGHDSKALLYVSYMYGLILGGWQQLRLERHFGSMKHNFHCPHTVFLYCELGRKWNEKKRKEGRRREEKRENE